MGASHDPQPRIQGTDSSCIAWTFLDSLLSFDFTIESEHVTAEPKGPVGGVGPVPLTHTALYITMLNTFWFLVGESGSGLTQPHGPFVLHRVGAF